MTARRRRLEVLEAAQGTRPVPDGARCAYFEGLSDRELDELHVTLLRRDGHPDPEGEAARVRAEIHAMTDAQLWALIDGQDGGTL